MNLEAQITEQLRTIWGRLTTYTKIVAERFEAQLTPTLTPTLEVCPYPLFENPESHANVWDSIISKLFRRAYGKV